MLYLELGWIWSERGMCVCVIPARGLFVCAGLQLTEICINIKYKKVKTHKNYKCVKF